MGGTAWVSPTREVGFTHPTDRWSRAAGFWRYDKIPAHARPAGGGHAFGAPAGRARQDLAPSGGRRALSPALALRRWASAGCHWHVAGCGPGGGWRCGACHGASGVMPAQQSRRIQDRSGWRRAMSPALAPPGIAPLDVPPARRKTLAGVWGGWGGFGVGGAGFTHPRGGFHPPCGALPSCGLHVSPNAKGAEGRPSLTSPEPGRSQTPGRGLSRNSTSCTRSGGACVRRHRPRPT